MIKVSLVNSFLCSAQKNILSGSIVTQEYDLKFIRLPAQNRTELLFI